MITTNRMGPVIFVSALFLMPGLALAQNLTPSDSVSVQMGSNNPGTNNGHLQVQYSLNGQNQNVSTQSLIKFDLSALAAAGVTSSDIQSANLILFVNSGGGPGGNVTVCELAGTWSSSSITGTNAPACPAGANMVPFPVTSSQLKNGAFISVPVTGIVQSWVGPGATPNNGIELEADAPMPTGSQPENVQFDALANNGQGFAPMLQVVTGVASISTPALSGLKVNGGAGPASGADSLAVDTSVIATNTSVSLALSSLSNDFLSLQGGTVTGTVAAQFLNSANTFQIGGTDVLKADSNNNSAVGKGACTGCGTGASAGRENTATGNMALNANVGGSHNTAHGSGALSKNTTGNDNTAHGWDTLTNVSTGIGNTAVGSGADSMNTTGSNNVAHGMGALGSHTAGDDNTAIGTQAGMNLQTGTKNVLMGKKAGKNLASTESWNIMLNNQGAAGDNNTIRIGKDLPDSTDPTDANDQQTQTYIAGIKEKDHSQNTNAKHVLIDTTTGQLGIDPTDAQTSVASISTSTGLKNTGTAGAPTLAVDTTVIAQQSDVTNAITTAATTATSLASAAQAAAQAASLSLALGGKVNAAVEAAKLNSDSTLQIAATDVLKADAAKNTATGFNALISATTAAENDAHGEEALKSLTTGIQNTAHGKETLKMATTASDNAANGYQALLNELTGNNNVAHGMQTLMSHTDGDDNTAIGTQAGLNLKTGTKNVLLGKLAGQNLKTTESKEILINHDGVTGESNTTRIGNDNDQQKAYIAGVYSKTTDDLSSAIQVVIDKNGNLGTVPSSRRYKEDIHDMGGASDALLRLRPVTFRYKKPDSDGSKPVQYGLIAEEVAEVYPNLVVHGKDGQVETVQYYKLDAMLLNEVQKLSRANAADQAEIATLQLQVAEQLKQGREQQAAIRQLMAQVHGIQATVANSRSAHQRARVANAATKKVQKKTTKPEVKHPTGQVIASLSVPMR